MRKIMEIKIEELNNKKREIMGINVALHSKYEVLSKIEKDIYDKLIRLDEVFVQKIQNNENEYMNKNKERLEIEAINRVMEVELRNEIKTNEELEFDLTNTAKMEDSSQNNFEKSLKIIKDLYKTKETAYEEINGRIV